MAYGKRVTWDTIREIDFDSLSDSYVAVGSSFSKSIRAIKFTNSTDNTVYFTDDGTNDKLKLPKNSYAVWDITTNKSLSDLPQFVSAGTQISCRYITGSAPTSGWVSVETLTVETGS